MSTSAYPATAAARAPSAALFGRVMGLVAITVAFATLGVRLGRDSGGTAWFVAWLLSLGCLVGLNVANARGATGVALTLLFAFGPLVGWSVATTVNQYAQTDPQALGPGVRQLGLVVVGLYTVVDFNRLRRAGQDEAIPLAAGIFLDVLNIFLLLLRLFGNR